MDSSCSEGSQRPGSCFALKPHNKKHLWKHFQSHQSEAEITSKENPSPPFQDTTRGFSIPYLHIYAEICDSI